MAGPSSDLTVAQRRRLEEEGSESGRNTVRVRVKGRAPVDASVDADVAAAAHVLDLGGPAATGLFDAAMTATDVAAGTNSYYGLQVLESDAGAPNAHKYWVFRKWGRTGTRVGGTKLEPFGSGPSARAAARASFCALYLEKSGLEWGVPIRRVPGRFLPVEQAVVEAAGSSAQGSSGSNGPPSLLPPSVQRVIEAIFDAGAMTRSLRELDIDLDRMPVARLSANRVKEGYAALAELSALVDELGTPVEGAAPAAPAAAPAAKAMTDEDDEEEEDEDGSTAAAPAVVDKRIDTDKLSPAARLRLTAANNKFFTLVPHTVGNRTHSSVAAAAADPLRAAWIVKSSEQIRAKSALLETLRDMADAITLAAGAESAGTAAEAAAAAAADAEAQAAAAEAAAVASDSAAGLSEAAVAHAKRMRFLARAAASSNPLDKKYAALRAHLEPVDPYSGEYALLEQYLVNTHAATHSSYRLRLVSAFRVDREGEAQRYAQYCHALTSQIKEDLAAADAAAGKGDGASAAAAAGEPTKRGRGKQRGRDWESPVDAANEDPRVSALLNRRLLWHGSRTTNYGGILSQGLRIAPPEAPVTGYMFGKGIYTADMSSKSANYVFASRQAPEGFMLLCETALGAPLRLTQAEYVTKLPKGTHSTYGIGRTAPDPGQESRVAGVHREHHIHGPGCGHEADAVAVRTGKGVLNPDLVAVARDRLRAELEQRLRLTGSVDGSARAAAAAAGGKKSKKGKAAAAAVDMTVGMDAAALAHQRALIDARVAAVKPDDARSSLLYNEFIVYDAAQICMRYLLHVRFEYN